MRLSMWTSYLHELSPEEMVETFARKGWNWLELSTEHSGVLAARGDPTRVGGAFRSHAERHGVSLP